MRRHDDMATVEHVGDARQLVWNVTQTLKARGAAGETLKDLEAVDHLLARATTDLTHRRALSQKEEPMDLRLDTVKQKDVEVVTPARAEVISEAWQAVAFVDELRTKLNKSVRNSTSRDMASNALASAITQLVLAASLLVPTGIVEALPKLASQG